MVLNRSCACTISRSAASCRGRQVYLNFQHFFNLSSCSTHRDKLRIRSLSSYQPAAYPGQPPVPRGVARLAFIARIERAPLFHRARSASKKETPGCSLFPSSLHTPPFLSRVAWIGPSPRASRDHFPKWGLCERTGPSMQPFLFHFQAFDLASTTLQRVVCLVSHCARPTRAFSGPRVARAQETNRPPSPSLDCPFHRHL